MGLMRKLLLVSTAGVAPVKAESYKERSAKAAEKQLRLQQQAARSATAVPTYAVTCPHCKTPLNAPAGDAIRCPKCRNTMKVTPVATTR